MRKLLTLLILLCSGLAWAGEDFKFDTAPGTYPAGTNVTATATLGANAAPAIAAANWTCGAGWDCSVSGTLNKNADGVGTAVPNPALTIVAGTTYRVDITLGAVTVGNGATWTLGGVTGVALTAVATYTDYVTAVTTANLIITPTPTATRFTVTAVSVRALTNATGDLTVDGNLTVNSGSTFEGNVLFPDGLAAAPGGAFASQPGTGFYYTASTFNIGTAGARRMSFTASGTFSYSILYQAADATSSIVFGTSNDTHIVRDAANSIQFGTDAATASANTIKGPDSTGASQAGGLLYLGSSAGGSGGERGPVAVKDDGTKPTCAAGIRGAIWYDAGGAGVLDTFEVCRKDASNNYAWVTLF